MQGDEYDWMEFMGELNEIRGKLTQASDALRDGNVMLCQALLDEACDRFNRMTDQEIESPVFRGFLDGLEDEE